MFRMMVRMMVISAQDGQDDGLDDGKDIGQDEDQDSLDEGQDDDEIHQIRTRGQLMVTLLKIRKFVLTLVKAQGTRRVQQKKR